MIYFSPVCLDHNPPHEFDGKRLRPYPENPNRLKTILEELKKHNMKTTIPSKFEIKHIKSVHEDNYVNFIESFPEDTDYIAPTSFNIGGSVRSESSLFAKLGHYFFDPATPINHQSVKAAHGAVNCVLSMAQNLANGSSRSAALCRPPGHHAMKAKGGGYCIYNNVAIAAQYLSNRGKRISILDLDYHHGNGTQEIFYDRGDVQYVSIHADTESNYPFYWGSKEERGEGEGEGSTHNLPVSNFISAEEYLSTVDMAINHVLDFKADIVLLSMGFDCYIDDPIAGLSLETETYEIIGKKLKQFSQLGVVLEGGYDTAALGKCFVKLYQNLQI